MCEQKAKENKREGLGKLGTMMGDASGVGWELGSWKVCSAIITEPCALANVRSERGCGLLLLCVICNDGPPHHHLTTTSRAAHHQSSPHSIIVTNAYLQPTSYGRGVSNMTITAWCVSLRKGKSIISSMYHSFTCTVMKTNTNGIEY